LVVGGRALAEPELEAVRAAMGSRRPQRRHATAGRAERSGGARALPGPARTHLLGARGKTW